MGSFDRLAIKLENISWGFRCFRWPTGSFSDLSSSCRSSTWFLGSCRRSFTARTSLASTVFSFTIVGSWVGLRGGNHTHHVHHNVAGIWFHAYFVVFHIIVEDQVVGLLEPESAGSWMAGSEHLKPGGSSVHTQAHSIDRILGVGHLVGCPPGVGAVLHLHLQVPRDNIVRTLHNLSLRYWLDSWGTTVFNQEFFVYIRWTMNLTNRLLAGKVQVHAIGEVPVVLWTWGAGVNDVSDQLLKDIFFYSSQAWRWSDSYVTHMSICVS